MKYYLTASGQLIAYSPKFDQYRQRNRVGPGLGLLPVAGATPQAWLEIKRSRFSQLMNEFFKTVEDSWTHRGEAFRKLPNYDITHQPRQPRHGESQLFVVYHWGQLYYYQYSYGGFGVGILYDFKSLALARWAKPQHCAPVFNESRKQII